MRRIARTQVIYTITPWSIKNEQVGSHLSLSLSLQFLLGRTGWQELRTHSLYPQETTSSGCDEGTRLDVLNDIEGCLGDPTNPIRLLFLTGAAGAGKSTIHSTVTQRCKQRPEVLVASFIMKPHISRNLVPTIAFQLGSQNASLKGLIGEAVEGKPEIFDVTPLSQMETLIIDPTRKLHSLQPQTQATHIILIDSLDECNNEEQLSELAEALCLLQNAPFRLFITARTEALWPMERRYKDRDSMRVLRLSDEYDATDDIQRSLELRFAEIRAHPANSRVPQGWPKQEDVEYIVRYSQGQYIVAMTIARYLDEPRRSPVSGLEMVLNWIKDRRRDGEISGRNPFEPLDHIYENILRKAQTEFQEKSDLKGQFSTLISVFQTLSKSPQVPWKEADMLSDFTTDHLAGEEDGTCERLFLDLASVMVFKEPAQKDRRKIVHFYHTSFYEYLHDPARSKEFHVSRDQETQHVVSRLLQYVVNMKRPLRDHDLESFRQERKVLRKPVLIHIPYLLDRILKRSKDSALEILHDAFGSVCEDPTSWERFGSTFNHCTKTPKERTMVIRWICTLRRVTLRFRSTYGDSKPTEAMAELHNRLLNGASEWNRLTKHCELCEEADHKSLGLLATSGAEAA